MRIAETKVERWDRFPCAFEVKAADSATGRFEGLAAVYGNLDRNGDVIERGAFTKTLSESGRDVPLLWQHDLDEPIGLMRLEDGEKGLIAHGEIDLDVPTGKRAFSAVQRRYVRGLSIGYDAVKHALLPNGVRQLLELKLWEVSVVTFPANPLAGVTRTKALATLARLGAVDELDVVAERAQALHDLVTTELKQGRVLSDANLARLMAAIESLQAIHTAAVPAPPTKTATSDAAQAAGAGDAPLEPELLHSLQALTDGLKQARAEYAAKRS